MTISQKKIDLDEAAPALPGEVIDAQADGGNSGSKCRKKREPGSLRGESR